VLKLDKCGQELNQRKSSEKDLQMMIDQLKTVEKLKKSHDLG
jgi:hypothetical protein